MIEKLCINGHSWIQPEKCPCCGEESIWETEIDGNIMFDIGTPLTYEPLFYVSEKQFQDMLKLCYVPRTEDNVVWNQDKQRFEVKK